MPFAEIPSLRNMVLTGEDDEDMSYMALNDGPYAIPPSNKRAIQGNDAHVNPFGGGASEFKPVYD